MMSRENEKKTAGQAQQLDLFTENHPLRQLAEWTTCLVRIAGEAQRVRIMGHYPNWGSGKVYLDRWDEQGRMFSTYVEYSSIELIEVVK
jgi:hypothetical protein